jgi:hypothetical protein
MLAAHLSCSAAIGAVERISQAANLGHGRPVFRDVRAIAERLLRAERAHSGFS